MESHNGLAGAGRTRYPRRSCVVLLHDMLLRRMEEDRPLLPWIIEGALQFCDIVHYTETALSVGMLKGVVCGNGLSGPRPSTDRQLEQRLCGLARQVLGKL